MLFSHFEKYFHQRHSVSAFAPGRVNLIGEHTDYNQGFVFPAAINFGTQVLAAPRTDRHVNIIALDFGGERNSFTLTGEIGFDENSTWSNYVRGVLKVLQETVGPIEGLDLLVSGNVPRGAGLSSSASFEIALLKAVNDVFSLGLNGVEAARIGQRAENEFVGCSCGIMDQLISANGRKGHAMLLDCRTLEEAHTPISADHQIVIINSNVERGLVDSEYNLRRQQCEAAALKLGVASLREADNDLLQKGKTSLAEKEFLRARHIVTENQRTVQMYSALREKNYDLVSTLMRESHLSMRDDFEITVEPIDYLVDLVHSVIGNTGGVRMTGGGFGGCIVALCPTVLVDDVKRVVADKYQAKTGFEEKVYICTAEDGAFSR